MVDYGGAFKKPFQDITKLVIGIVLMIIPIINFLSMGYFIETAKKTLNKDNSMPEWGNWVQLFIQGLLVVVITIIYFIPAMVLMLIGFAPLIGVLIGAAMGTGDPTSAFAGALAGAGILFLIALLVALITIFILPMALVFYARDGFGGAFKLGSVIKACLTGSYIVSWIIVLVLSVILMVVLGLIPFVGFAIASFYMGIVEYTLFSQVLLEQTGK
jgi:hypothetical protein